jgi:hypothetical protein
MPDDRTVFDRVMGNNTPSTPGRAHPRDIELPNRSGRTDPRLAAKAPSTKELGAKIVSGYRTVRKLGGSR